MKIAIQAGALVEALDHVNRAIDAKEARKFPVLGSVLIEVNAGAITLTATNLNRIAIAATPADIQESSAAVVDLERLGRLAGGFSTDAKLIISSDGGVAKISSGRARYQFSLLPIGDFPHRFVPGAAPGDEVHEIKLEPDEVANLFGATAFAISNEQTRHYLCGAYLHTIADQLIITATDGFVLAKASMSHRIKFPGVIIPRLVVEELVRMAKSPVVLRFDTKIIEIKASGNRILRSKMVDGTFPAYQRVIPAPSGNTAELNRGSLVAGLERLAAVAGPGGRAGLTWNGNGSVSLCLPDDDAANDEIEAVTGGALRIAVSAARFLELLEKTKGDRVRLDAQSGFCPMLITIPGDESFLAVTMPMTWARPHASAGR
jgi:DNA polymerase-3 subunit beta